MKRWFFLAYAIGGYVAFLGVYAYLAGFIGNVWVPKSIDGPVGDAVGGVRGESVGQAVAIDLLLLALFAAQHSVMARPGFKRVWTRVIPQPIERATYVWVANAVTVLLMWQWRPIDAVVWHVEQPVLRAFLWGLFVMGLTAVPAVTLLINHFDLFGLRQVWLHSRDQAYTSLPFRAPALYAVVRHPLYLAWALAFWAIPTMTAGHLLFAVTLCVYMVLATVFEERDLVAHFGNSYREYQQNVGRFVPRIGRLARGAQRVPKFRDAEASSPALAVAQRPRGEI
jgi:protein-S-isoprenylcysteine O-methyltransferase Ste14